MSWLLKSLQSHDPASPTSSPDDTPTSQNGGVKEDLSVLGDTIGRQLRGVAAFLAPPPSLQEEEYDDDDEQRRQQEEEPSDKLMGIRNDLAEIGGSFKSGLSLLSSNKAVSEISRFSSSFLHFPDQDHHYEDDDGIPGITEEVVEFVKVISSRPELWTDFPLSLNNDFKMSEAQGEHVENIQHLVPSLEALKIKLQHQMGDERLDEHDLELLSTIEIVETRDALLQKLQNSKNAQIENTSVDASQESEKFSKTKRESFSSEEQVIEIVNVAEVLESAGELNAEQLMEKADACRRSSVSLKKNLENEEDISFSDLEDDDDNSLPNRVSMPKSTHHDKTSSPSGSNDWVQLNKRSETRG